MTDGTWSRGSDRRQIEHRRMIAAMAAMFCGLLGLGVVSEVAEGAKLDPTFGGGGMIRSVEGEGARAARYPDGRVVLVGADQGEFLVARYLESGSPDTSFGTGGVARVSWSGPFHDATKDEAKASAVAVQPDGKILVGGAFEPNRSIYEGKAWRSVLARLNTDGSLDQSFRGAHAPAGKVQLRRPFWREFRAIALQGKKIVVAGETGFVARLNSDGTLDRSFAKGHGSLNVPSKPKDRKRFVRLAGVTGLLVADSGRIFASGYANGRVLVSRLHPNGVFDGRFGHGGTARIDASGKPGCRCSIGRGLARDRRGRLVVSGMLLRERPNAEFSADDVQGPAFLVRYRSDGTLDRSFGSRGAVRARRSGNRNLRGGTGVAVQANGRIVVTGQRFSRFAVARFRPSGSWDRAFFGNGIFSASFGSSSAMGLDPLVDTSGRILVAGQADLSTASGRPNLIAVRFRP